MHLLTFVRMKDPNLVLRAAVIVGQVCASFLWGLVYKQLFHSTALMFCAGNHFGTAVWVRYRLHVGLHYFSQVLPPFRGICRRRGVQHLYQDYQSNRKSSRRLGSGRLEDTSSTTYCYFVLETRSGGYHFGFDVCGPCRRSRAQVSLPWLCYCMQWRS
jgi:hypothetical protein